MPADGAASAPGTASGRVPALPVAAAVALALATRQTAAYALLPLLLLRRWESRHSLSHD